MKRNVVIIALAALALIIIPTAANAQSEANDYGIRIRSRDGLWLMPTASRLLGSHEQDHLDRGSVNAWDNSASLNSPIFSIGDGVVNFAGCQLGAAHGYGCWVRIDHSAHHEASYAHCAEGSIRVKAGDTVSAWTQICNVGMTGKTGWPHVHLVIKKDGVHDKIHNYFDPSLFRYCKFCEATNDPMQPILRDSGSQPVAQESQPAPKPVTMAEATQSTNALAAFLYKLGALPTATLATLLVVVIVLLVFLPAWRQTIVMAGVVGCAVLFISEVPVANIRASADVTSAEPALNEVVSGPAEMTEKEAFEIAYDFLNQPGVEGSSCTNDGAYSKSGITQGAYDLYRKRHGLPPADVCRSLTNEERKAIAYEDYWVKSGSHKLPYPLNHVHFDFVFNAGAEPGSPPAKILAQSNGDVNLYNQLRVEWYKGRKTCYLYCTGWINRVNKLQALIESSLSVASASRQENQ